MKTEIQEAGRTMTCNGVLYLMIHHTVETTLRVRTKEMQSTHNYEIKVFLVSMVFLQTCSRKCKDTLMYFASLKRVPVTPVLLTRSELEIKYGRMAAKPSLFDVQMI